MTDRILYVDDDLNTLAAFQRQLRNRFPIDTATSGGKGLDAVAERGPYAVIVTDMVMPGMNGIEFLREARKVAPDSTRIVLTGNATLPTAVAAVNEVNVSRFLTKPCPPATMEESLTACMAQYRLVREQKALLAQITPLEMAALRKALPGVESGKELDVSVNELTIHMTIAQNVMTRQGILLVSEGQALTFPLVERLKHLCANGSVKQQKFRVKAVDR